MSQPRLHCALYTRKSSEEGLEQAFNSLDAQREACGGVCEEPGRAGKKRLSGDTARQASSGEVKELRHEMRDLKA